MNGQKWIAALIVVAVSVSCICFAMSAELAGADTPLKEGYGSRDGVTVAYIDSETPSYGIMTIVLDTSPAADSLTVRIDGGDSSAPIPVPGNLRMEFAVPELTLGDHSVRVSWTGFVTDVTVSVIRQGESGVTGVVLNKTSDTVLPGTVFDITAELQPTGAAGFVSWSSDNPGVATVSNGRVTAMAVGTAVITASCNGHSATCTVTVKSGSSAPVNTEEVIEGGTVTRTGTVISFDDGTSKSEITEVTETTALVKNLDIVSETDTAGRTVSNESGTVTIKDSGVTLDIVKSSVSSGTSVVESNLSLTVSDSGITTSASEVRSADGKVTKSSVTSVVQEPAISDGKSSVTVDAASIGKVRDQIAAVSTQIDDLKPVMEISAKTTSSTTDSSVNVPSAALKDLAEATGAQVRLTTDVARMDFSSGAIKSICSAGSSDVRFDSKITDKNGLTEEQRKLVGENSAFTLSVSVGDSTVSDFGQGNKATVSLPYVLKDGESGSDVKVWCLTENGLEQFQCTYGDGFATFSTGHFSVWVVGMETPSDDGSSNNTQYWIIAAAAAGIIVVGLIGWLIVKHKH
jgi:hypothetical protein